MHAYEEEGSILYAVFKINLQGLGTGNGLVHPKIQYR